MTQIEVEQNQAANDLANLVYRKRVSHRGPQLKKVQKNMDLAAEIAKDEKRWKEFNAPLLVSLYAWLHTQVYDVDPSSALIGKSGIAARKQAKNILENEFGGDHREMLMFMRWVWFRERDREKWRIANRKTGSQISWMYQFSPRLVVEYKITKRRFEPNSTRVSNSIDSYPIDNRVYSLGT